MTKFVWIYIDFVGKKMLSEAETNSSYFSDEIFKYIFLN